MGEKAKGPGRFELSRRDFLKVSAAGAAAGMALDLVPAPAMATTPVLPDTAINVFNSTCPYCSAQCGQKVAVGNVTKAVYDIYGDFESPTNRGGLCAKGAGSFQLATNLRRAGVAGFPSDPNFAGKAYPDSSRSMFAYDGAYTDGIAYKRTANGTWDKMSLDAALAEIGPALVTARGGVPLPGNTSASNKTGVMFFGCSHMNNEQNYLYRKTIAAFGTSMTEHQARI
jgi:formate dehydrogenase major subunit